MHLELHPRFADGGMGDGDDERLLLNVTRHLQGHQFRCVGLHGQHAARRMGYDDVLGAQRHLQVERLVAGVVDGEHRPVLCSLVLPLAAQLPGQPERLVLRRQVLRPRPGVIARLTGLEQQHHLPRPAVPLLERVLIDGGECLVELADEHVRSPADPDDG